MWKRLLSPLDIVIALGWLASQRVKRSIGTGILAGEVRSRESQRPISLRILVTYSTLVILAAAPALYLGWGQVKGFNSPDESAAYVAGQLFVEEGRLYIKDTLTELNPSVPTGPRGFTQLNDRSVPIYPLGHPLVVGIAHSIFGRVAPLVLAIIPGLLVLSLALLVRVLLPNSPAHLGFIFLSIVPFWYWSSRVYMNLALSLLFISLGVLCLAIAVKQRSVYWLLGGSSALALGALMRHPEAVFLLIIAIAFLVAFIRRQPSFHWGYAIRAFGWYALPQVLLFLLPMALLNWWTYGSATEIGYLANYNRNLPDRLPTDSNLLITAFDYAKLALFPVPVSFKVLFWGGLFQILLIAPFAVALGISGFVLARNKLLGVFGYPGLALIALGLVYVLVSRSDPGTFRALATEPDVRASIIRYWMPIYVVLGIGAAYALGHFPRNASLVIVGAMVFFGMLQVWVFTPESVLGLKYLMNREGTQYAALLNQFTETDSVIFAGDRTDKWAAPLRRTAVTWSGTPTRDGLHQVAEAAGEVYSHGQPVYFLLSPEQKGNLSLLTQELASQELNLERLPASARGDVGLWKIVGSNRPIDINEMEPGIFSAQISAAESLLTVEIGSVIQSHVFNNSFESGLSGWSGPGEEIEVNSTSERSFVGQSSLMMQLFPSSAVGELARRTYTVNAKALNGDAWYAISHAMVSGLVDAEVSMRVFVSDEDGNRLDRYETHFTKNTTDIFQPLVIHGEPLSPNASSIAFQLAMRSLAVGGRGIVFWDGADLITGASIQNQDCDEQIKGDCQNAKTIFSSGGKINSGIESIRFRSLNGAEAILNGPFYQGDRLRFKENAVYLERDGIEREAQVRFATSDEGDDIEMLVTSTSPPILKVSHGS